MNHTTNPQDARAELSAKLWQIAEQHIVAEWICCEPCEPKHELCAKGYAALAMARTLLVDDPGAARSAPLLDAVIGMLPAVSPSVVVSADRATLLLWAADQIDAETRQAKAYGVLEPDKYRPCRDASAQLRALAGCASCAAGIEHDEHCPTPESHNWGCGCPSDKIRLYAENGVDTPGCDCGHDGMGLRWHSEACSWVVGLVAEARQLLATEDTNGSRLAAERPAVVEQPDTQTREAEHIGGQANAEDCPACKGTNPPYPFLCPGPPAP